MKRSAIVSLIIGFAVAIVVGVVHATGIASRFELAATEYVSHATTATRVIGKTWQVLFILVFALGVAWMTLTTSHRRRVAWIVGILLLELVGVAWVCSLYHVYLQPLPSMVAAALAFAAAEGWRFF